MTRRGFTIVELIIVITIIGILLTLAVVSLQGTQTKARDDERKADIEAIQTHLESVYTAGISSTGSSPTLTNLVINPSFETSAAGWVASCGASSFTRTTSQYYRGTASARLDTTAADQCAYYSGSGFIVTTAGRTYSMSAWVRGSGSAQLTVSTLPGGAFAGTSPTVTLTNSWQRLTATGTTASGATNTYPVIWQRSGGTQSIYVDAVMATETPITYNYGDGTTNDWAWTGTAHNSDSTGPAIVTGAPGGYPSTSTLSSTAMLDATFPDADTKIFLPPGVSDPLLGFVIATNNNQTTSSIAPQPTTSQYVYQPIDSAGNLCTDVIDCRKFNIYYRLEEDNAVYMVTSKNQ